MPALAWPRSQDDDGKHEQIAHLVMRARRRRGAAAASVIAAVLAASLSATATALAEGTQASEPLSPLVAPTGGTFAFPAPRDATASVRLDPPTWADEFEGTALDSTKWGPRATGVRFDGNLTLDAVSVANGLLTITTYTENAKHYSGMISSLAGSVGFEQKFGYFEAKAKFRSAPGQWSAFWLQTPTNGNPPGDPATAGVEMDIAEHRACLGPPPLTPPQICAPANVALDRIQEALIWEGYAPGVSQSAIKLSDPLPGLGNDSWHTYALNWTPTEVTFYFDDREIWSRTTPISLRSQHIILSSEVRAFFAGPIPVGGYGTRATSTTNMQVDYVRAWSTPLAEPLATSAPVASGAAAEGAALACAPGTWSGTPAPTLAYQWLSDGSAIAGATSSGRTVLAADRGHALSCRVTATNLAGAASAQSNAIAIPAPALPPVLTTSSPPPLPAPPPPAPLDTTAPRATLSGATTQRVASSVTVSIACRDEPCRAAVTGTVAVPRVGRARARSYRPAAVVVIGGGATRRVRLTLSASARSAIRRALRAHRGVTVRVSVRISDRAGNARTLSRRIALRLAPRRPAT
ncbi:MAG: hypothetical protein QOG42_1868 [Solirubrobacteraceae bacterium]|nr:hypothetical protein [Solirubrobacteraceae bacterium]